MTIIADSTEAPTRPRTLLASIDRRELVRILYGETTTADQQAALAQLAEEASVDYDLIAPATGEPDEDPRTGATIPEATYDDEDIEDMGEWQEPREPTAEELADLEDDLDTLVRDDMVVVYMADVAELLNIPAHDAEELIRGWRIPPDDDILTLLLDADREVMPRG